MRDIREDLRERIAAEHAQREPHTEALKQIDRNIADLQRLLEFEEARVSARGAAAPLPRPAASLDDYVWKLLRT
ncbi:MAG TPA: hypothetical protein VKB67_07415, partial [Rhizomicrobium sp.]|nr:hypothetical protein [Rhizomicrobium sp.]